MRASSSTTTHTDRLGCCASARPDLATDLVFRLSAALQMLWSCAYVVCLGPGLASSASVRDNRPVSCLAQDIATRPWRAARPDSVRCVCVCVCVGEEHPPRAPWIHSSPTSWCGCCTRCPTSTSPFIRSTVRSTRRAASTLRWVRTIKQPRRIDTTRMCICSYLILDSKAVNDILRDRCTTLKRFIDANNCF